MGTRTEAVRSYTTIHSPSTYITKSFAYSLSFDNVFRVYTRFEKLRVRKGEEERKERKKEGSRDVDFFSEWLILRNATNSSNAEFFVFRPKKSKIEPRIVRFSRSNKFKECFIAVTSFQSDQIFRPVMSPPLININEAESEVERMNRPIPSSYNGRRIQKMS